MKSNQNGFSVVEIIMAIVIVGLLAAVGWLYWDKVATKAGDNGTSTSSIQSKQSATLKTYTSKDLGVAFDYPQSWTVTPNTKSKFKDSVQGGENMLVKASSGFTMLFNTVATDGLGGTGPCEIAIKDFVYEGTPKIDKAYVVSFNDNGTFVLRLSISKTADYGPVSCPNLDYGSIVNIKDPTLSSDGLKITKPYQLLFGTFVFDEDAISKTRPSDKEYKEAVDILKSVRKV